MLCEEIIVDEFGRLWLATEDGQPYSGPYDTIEDAEAALNSDNEDGDS